MRWGLMVGVCAIAGCAGNQLASTPPAGVDLSGHWNLNLADSDDAQRLMQSQIAAATSGVDAGGSTGGGGGRQRGRGGGMPAAAGPGGPVMPSVSVLDESLRWPGKDLAIEQTSDRITFISDGGVRFCRPSAHKGGGHHSHLRRRRCAARIATCPRAGAAMHPRRAADGTSARWSCSPASPTRTGHRTSSASASRTTVSGWWKWWYSRADARADSWRPASGTARRAGLRRRRPHRPGWGRGSGRGRALGGGRWGGVGRRNDAAAIKKPGIARLSSPHAYRGAVVRALAMIGLFYTSPKMLCVRATL